MSDKDKNIEQENIDKDSLEEVKAEEVSSDEVKAEEVSSDEEKVEESPSDEENSKEDKVNSSASFLLGKKIGMTSVYSEDGYNFLPQS